MKLTVGGRYIFFFLHYDVEGSSKMADEGSKKRALDLLHDLASAALKHYGARHWERTGGDGQYASFYGENDQVALNVIYAGQTILEIFNGLKSLHPILSQSGLRVLAFQGVAVFGKKLTEYQSEDLDRYIKNERAYALRDRLTINASLFQRLHHGRSRFHEDLAKIPGDGDTVRSERVYRNIAPEIYCIFAHNGIAHEKNRTLPEYTGNERIFRMFIQAKHYEHARDGLVKLLRRWKENGAIHHYIALVLHGPDEIFAMFEADQNATVEFYDEIESTIEPFISDRGITKVGPGETLWNPHFKNLFPINSDRRLSYDFLNGRTGIWIIRMFWPAEDFQQETKEFVVRECEKEGGLVLTVHFDTGVDNVVTCLVTLLLPCGHYEALKTLSRALERVVTGDRVGLRKTYHAYDVIDASWR